jgi:hypothetical protein
LQYCGFVIEMRPHSKIARRMPSGRGMERSGKLLL